MNVSGWDEEGGDVWEDGRRVKIRRSWVNWRRRRRGLEEE